MKIVDIKNLIVDFDIYDSDNVVVSKKRVLDDISLTINKGEFICILGKNGCGKSTFAKCLNGLVSPTSGEVLVFDLDTKDEKNLINIRQKVGMTFQNPDNQIVASIVEEDIAFGLENLGIESNEMKKRIESAVTCLGIENLKNSMTSKLSGGQKQKVSIAGILAMKPEIIVLDEPTSMVDKAGRIDILETVKRLNKEENITIILISHYLEEVQYADRVVLINKGKITLDDTPERALLNEKQFLDAGLELPYIPKIATELRDMGKKLKGNEIKVNELCRYLK